MKKYVNKILMVSVWGLGMCAVAKPALTTPNKKFFSLIGPAAQQPTFPAVFNEFRSSDERKSEYRGRVVAFRSHQIVATQTGTLQDWLIDPGDPVSQLDKVALVSIKVPFSENAVLQRNNGTNQSPISPGPIRYSIEKPDKKPVEVLQSPAAGKLQSAGVKVGDSVSRGSTVALVINQQYSILKFSVKANDFRRLKKSKGVEVRTPKYPGERFIGLIKSLNKQSKNGINQVHVEINNLPDFVFQPGTEAVATFRFPG